MNEVNKEFPTKLVDERLAYRKIKAIYLKALNEPCASKRRMYKRAIMLITAIGAVINETEISE